MNKLLGAFVALFFAFAATAQDKQTVQVNVLEPVIFDHLLLPGASAQPLEMYSAYAAGKNASFNFAEAAVGKMQQCQYTVTCDKGKITSVFFGVKDADACKELAAFVETRLGAPKTENIIKTDGKEEVIQRTYYVNGRKAQLSIEVNKSAYLTMK